MSANATALLNRMIAKVRLRHLQLVVLTAELGNTHKVAAEAGLSQPSVVKFLNDLENLLGVDLFERHSRGMRSTHACRILLPALRGMLRLAQTGTQSLADLQSGAAGVVHVGALPATCHGLLMKSLATFADRHPDISFHLREAAMSDLLKDLAVGVFDVLLIREPAQVPQGYRFTPLLEDHPVVVARAGHGLAERRALGLDVLAQQQWVAFPDSMTSRIVFDSWFSDTTHRPHMLNVTTSSLSAILAIVAESNALVVLPHSLAASSLASGRFCLLDVAQTGAIRPLGLLWQPDTALAAVRVFCEWMLAQGSLACPDTAPRSAAG